MIDEDMQEYEIVFSKIAGKKCTYKIKDHKIIERYGDDANAYINFWGEEPRY